MQFTLSVAALFALAGSSLVAAQTDGFDPITSPTQDQNLTSGSSFDIVWEPSVSGTVTITLLQGQTPSTLELGDEIASSIDNSAGTYAWTVPSSSYTTYGFKIALDSDPSTYQYSFPFHIIGGSSSSSSSSIVSSSGSTTAAGPASSTEVSSSSVKTSSASSTVAVVTSTTVTPVTTAASSTIAIGNGTTLVTSQTSASTGSLGPVSTSSSTTTAGSISASATANAATANLAASGMGLAGLFLSFAMML